MKKIKKGDEVMVTTGRSRGMTGTVTRVMGDRLIVENVNLVKRHTKPDPNAGVAGGIVEKESPVHVSNVKLFNPDTGEGDRVGIRSLDDGRKVRFYKSTGETVDA